MKHYENVRLRKGIGWVDASGDGFVAPPDGEEFEIAARPAGADGFLVYAVDVPRAVAVLMRRPQDLSWSPAEAAFDRLLSAGFATVVLMSPDAPGAAVARCHSSAPEALEDAACALWALKAKGGWDESPIMTFQIALPLGEPARDGPKHYSIAWLMARSSDAFAVDVSRARSRWDTVRAELSAAPDPTAMRVILIDVDWMMLYNDAYTHEAGDLLLVRLWSCLEQQGARAGASVVRVGGEEFVVILNERAPGAAGRLGELLRQAVEELNIPFQHPERATVGHVTISAGVVAVGDLSRLADDASDAAYAAKSAGRNRVVVKAAGTSGGS
jgi:diguanylate cyclase (GGDEF)-like protein